MSKKQWYICTENKKDFKSKLVVQYFQTKQEAEKVLKQLIKNNKLIYAYVDFMWKQDILKVPFTFLHGKNVMKTDNILYYI